MYNIKFLNTYNSIISLRPIINPERNEDYYLQKLACDTYLENNKILIQNYGKLKTEFVINNDLIFLYASINNYKILFNLLKLEDVVFVKKVTTFDQDQLNILYNIESSEILGVFKYYTKSSFPVEFKIVNTFDCFNAYYKSNNLWPNKEAAAKLIKSFKESMTTKLLDDDPSEKVSTTEGNEFSFIYFYDLIIIIDYNKVDIKI